MSTQRNFKAKLILVQLIAIIPLLLFVFYVFDLWYDTARSSVLDNSINQAKLVANTVEDSFNIGVAVANIVATNPIVKSKLTSDPATIKSALAIVTENISGLSGIHIVDLSGNTLAFSRDLTPEQKKISIADRTYFQDVLETKKSVIADPLVGRFRNIASVFMATPMMDDGKVTAVVSTGYELEVLKNKLEEILSADDKRDILLYDKAGRLAFILYKPLPNEEEKAIFNNLPFLKNGERNNIKIIENQKLPNSDKLYMGASVPVNDFGWTVVNLVSTDDVLAPLYKVQGITWLVFLSALLFALSLISYIMRKIKMVY